MKESPAYFQGLKFNIKTGECLNRRPDDKFIEKPNERKIWRQALSKFKRGIRARAKVRAFDPLIEKVWADRQGQKSDTIGNNPIGLVNLGLTCLRNQYATTSSQKNCWLGFVLHHQVGTTNNPNLQARKCLMVSTRY